MARSAAESKNKSLLVAEYCGLEVSLDEFAHLVSKNCSNGQNVYQYPVCPMKASQLALVLSFMIVPQFVIEREIPGAGTLSEIQIRDISLHSLQTLKEMGPQIQWLHSYVTEDKVYCVYLAPDENIIREHARRAGIPA